jgi:hypothetical protein
MIFNPIFETACLWNLFTKETPPPPPKYQQISGIIVHYDKLYNYTTKILRKFFFWTFFKEV